jgi:hypothetical protein
MKRMTKIVQVKKNQDGDITDVKFEDGNQVSVQQAIDMAKNNQIEGVLVGKAKNGRETLRSQPNNIQEDNLSNLPTF